VYAFKKKCLVKLSGHIFKYVMLTVPACCQERKNNAGLGV
jgi:hypothetical protein